MQVAIMIHGQRQDAADAAKNAAVKLRSHGIEVLVEEDMLPFFKRGTVLPITSQDAHADVILSLGGDGTLLHGAQYALAWNAALIGVNFGHVGFLAECEVDALPSLLDKIISGEYETLNRTVLSVKAKGKQWYAVNDVSMTRGGYAHLITVTAIVDGEQAGRYVGDGVVLATPTGSTGYSLSAGGPIVSPNVNCMVLTPVCAHSLQHRPIVVHGGAKVQLYLSAQGAQCACLQVDGQTYEELCNGDMIEISQSEKMLRLIHTGKKSFFGLVHEKLSEWTR